MPMTDGGVEDGGGWKMKMWTLEMETRMVVPGMKEVVRNEGGSQEREMGIMRWDSRISRTTQ